MEMIRVAERVNPQKYGRLLSKTLPAVIKTEEENDRAVLLIEKLLEKGAKISLEENALLDLLWNLIADFEEKFYQPRDASPQEVLIELMNARGLKQTDLAKIRLKKPSLRNHQRQKRNHQNTSQSHCQFL